MNHARRPSVRAALMATLLLVGPALGGPEAAGQRDGDRKPILSLKAAPPVGFSPLRVRLTAELRGGANDYEEFYCPTIVWEWGDGTSSENTEDCSPFEAGRSEIRRRFSVEHIYRQADAYRVAVRLKQKSKVVAIGSASIQVRPGVREGGGLD